MRLLILIFLLIREPGTEPSNVHLQPPEALTNLEKIPRRPLPHRRWAQVAEQPTFGGSRPALRSDEN